MSERENNPARQFEMTDAENFAMSNNEVAANPDQHENALELGRKLGAAIHEAAWNGVKIEIRVDILKALLAQEQKDLDKKYDEQAEEK